MAIRLEMMHLGCAWCDQMAYEARELLEVHDVLGVDIMLTTPDTKLHRGVARHESRPHPSTGAPN